MERVLQAVAYRPGDVIGYVRGRPVPLIGGGAPEAPTMETVVESIKALTTESQELAKRLEESTDAEGRKALEDSVAELSKRFEALDAQKAAIEAGDAQKAMAAQVTDLSARMELMASTVRTDSKHRYDVPVSSDRAGNTDHQTKLWSGIALGHLKLEEGNISIANSIKSNGDQVERYVNAAKILHTTNSASGAEWIFTPVLGAFYEDVRLASLLLQELTDYPMTGKSNDIPMKTGGATVYAAAESTSANQSALVTASNLATGKVTLTAAKLMAISWYSMEEDEDSIVALVPKIREDLATALGEAREAALINGDSTASHMDSDTVEATAPEGLFKGFRKLAIASGLTKDMGTFSPANVIAQKRLHAKFARSPHLLWILSPQYIELMISSTIGATYEGWAPHVKVNEDGMTGTILGSKFIVSEAMREDVNASGVYDGTTTDNTTALLIRKDRFASGTRRNLTIKTLENPRADQTEVIASNRIGFAPVVTPNSTTEKSASIGINIGL